MLRVRGESGKVLAIFSDIKKIKILCWDLNHVPNINICFATTPRASWIHWLFYNINTNVKISTKEKENQSKNEDGTNSFGVDIVKPIALIRLSLSIQKIYRLLKNYLN